MRLGWYVQTRKLDVASIRFRCFHMAAALHDAGITSLVFDDPAAIIRAIPEFDAIIIVKRMDSSIIDVAAAAKDRRKAVLIDLCDDVLAAEYRPSARELNRAVFRGVLPLVDAVITTGPAMTERLRRYDFHLPSVVEAPDIAETKQVVAATTAFARALFPKQIAVEEATSAPELSEAERVLSVATARPSFLKKAQRAALNPLWAIDRTHQLLSARVSVPGRTGAKLAIERIACRGIGRVNALAKSLTRDTDASFGLSAPPIAEATARQKEKVDRRPRVVWFGNHGAPHSTFGMLSLLQVADSLRVAYAKKPFVLELVSNNREKFDAFLTQIGIPCIYVPWTLDGIYDSIDRATVALITSGDDAFCDVKSANRALQALGCGKPVVGTPSRSLTPLSNFVLQGDVGEGILRYLNDASLRASHVEAAQEAIRRDYSFETVAKIYKGALAKADALARTRPVVERVGRTGSRLLFFLDLAQDLAVLQPLLKEARAAGVETLVVATPRAGRKTPGLTEFLISEKLIPTMVTEEDLSRGDARWLRAADVVIMAAESSMPPHRVAHALAGLAGRHGIPTVSLQHGLEVVGLTAKSETEAVRFNSDVIFTWNDPATLPDWLDIGIRQRCVGLGRSWRPPQGALANGGNTVGVFENLHWERYSKEYRRAFVDDLLRAADAAKESRFIVHPHPAGMWFRKHGPQALPSNVAMVEQVGEGMRILASSSRVVTTPSTIALDAAQIGRPVAVAQYDLADISTYEPLPTLQGTEDWMRFVAGVGDETSKQAQQAFYRRVCQPGDATNGILKAILNTAEGRIPV